MHAYLKGRKGEKKERERGRDRRSGERKREREEEMKGKRERTWGQDREGGSEREKKREREHSSIFCFTPQSIQQLGFIWFEVRSSVLVSYITVTSI